MTPATFPDTNRSYLPPPRVESPIQMIQGWYYVLAGLGVAVAITVFQSPVTPRLDLGHLWMVRIIGLIVAAVGVGLIFASRPTAPVPGSVGVPVVLAIVLVLADITGCAAGVLPSTFLIDAGMEGGFFVWWLVALFIGGKLVSQG